MNRTVAFEVLLVGDAVRDIEDIHAYIAVHDSVERADGVVDTLEEICSDLSDLPERGNTPKELVDLGMTEYREFHYKPYRVIYRIIGEAVVIYCVLDGRRDMESLLHRHLLR